MIKAACFMVTEPSVDEELVPKNEDENGNQEILMDQVFYNKDDHDDCDNHDYYDLEKEEEEKGERMREKLMEKKKVLPKDEDDNWNGWTF